MGGMGPDQVWGESMPLDIQRASPTPMHKFSYVLRQSELPIIRISL